MTMTRWFLVLFLTGAFRSAIVAAATGQMYYLSENDERMESRAVMDLIWRLIPGTADRFSVLVDRSFLAPDGKEQFNLNSINSESSDSNDTTNVILITATSGPAAANGFHFYLKYYLNMHVSWSGDQLTLPPSTDLPVIINKTVILQDKYRYYFNVCTFSYSTVWWNWQRWQRELDFMAMNGVNFALAFTGQEYIWQKLFLELGLTQDEVDDYFTGPAFLAWNRMSNIEKLYGPLAQSFIEGQRFLARKINRRMKQLGIKRISPGFSGHLPGSFKRIAPNATLIRLPNWGNFNDSFSSIYLLDPRDPMFVKIGAKFTQMFNEEFGSDHFYNVDLFNEMTPPTHDLNYLTNSGKAVFNSLIESDPLATWIMQGWLFHNDLKYWQVPEAKALITSVPLGKLIILDLYSESNPQFNRLHGYFGVPFIWCMLLNFGGVSGMFGNLHLVNEGVHSARAKYLNMLGIGITPEGIENNDIMYDFMLESSLRTAPTNLTEWIINFATRRYGIRHKNVTDAWLIFGSTVYNETTRIDNHGRYEVTSRPSLNLPSTIWYDIDLLEIATGLMYSSSSNKFLKSSETFKYDYVNSVRQWLQVLFSLNYKDFVKSFHERNVDLMVESSGKMVQIFKDMEKLLKTDVHFSLENWLSSAASWATSHKERIILVEQAKNQLTLWGFNGEIVDYAAKQWSGLMSDYYEPRWQLFFNLTISCIQSNCSSFQQDDFNKRVLREIEKPFTTKSNIGHGFTSGVRLVTLPIKDQITPISRDKWAIYSIENAISVASAIFEGSNFKYRMA